MTADDVGEVTVLAVGDIALGCRTYWLGGRTSDPKSGDMAQKFDLCRDLLRASDITFANLEGPYSDLGDTEPGRISSFRCPPAGIGVIQDAGFDIVSVANNHTMDLGGDAFLDTLSRLSAAGIRYVGGGENIAAARAPAVIERHGIRIAFLACATNINTPRKYAAGLETPGCAPMRVSALLPDDHLNQEDLAALLASVRAARRQFDAVIVSCHWGVSDGGTRTLAVHQMGLARRLAEAGADLVLGHHPHVEQAVAVIEGVPVCYSLGNFVLDYTGRAHPPTALAVEATVGRHGVARLRLIPITFEPLTGRPYVPGPDNEQYRTVLSDLGAHAALRATTIEAANGRIDVTTPLGRQERVVRSV